MTPPEESGIRSACEYEGNVKPDQEAASQIEVTALGEARRSTIVGQAIVGQAATSMLEGVTANAARTAPSLQHHPFLRQCVRNAIRARLGPIPQRQYPLRAFQSSRRPALVVLAQSRLR